MVNSLWDPVSCDRTRFGYPSEKIHYLVFKLSNSRITAVKKPKKIPKETFVRATLRPDALSSGKKRLARAELRIHLFEKKLETLENQLTRYTNFRKVRDFYVLLKIICVGIFSEADLPLSSSSSLSMAAGRTTAEATRLGARRCCNDRRGHDSHGNKIEIWLWR